MVEALRTEIVAGEKTRHLYSMIVLLVIVAILVGGYGEASSMNSGSFIKGLSQFFQYPGEIAVEA